MKKEHEKYYKEVEKAINTIWKRTTYKSIYVYKSYIRSDYYYCHVALAYGFNKYSMNTSFYVFKLHIPSYNNNIKRLYRIYDNIGYHYFGNKKISYDILQNISIFSLIPKVTVDSFISEMDRFYWARIL